MRILIRIQFAFACLFKNRVRMADEAACLCAANKHGIQAIIFVSAKMEG